MRRKSSKSGGNGARPRLTLISPPEVEDTDAAAPGPGEAEEPPALMAAAVELPHAPAEAAPAASAPQESIATRVRRLQAEAQALARQQILELQQSMRSLAALAEEVAGGGDAYPVGARELAHRVADDMHQKAQWLQALLAKHH